MREREREYSPVCARDLKCTCQKYCARGYLSKIATGEENCPQSGEDICKDNISSSYPHGY